MRILICEDEPAISDSLQYALKHEHFACTVVSLGARAVAAIAAAAENDQPFDLLILDVGLPDISGIEVCKAVRSHSNVPIVFLTARNDEIDRVLGLELGADDYIGKPFSPREVVARVKAVLRRSTAAPSMPVAQADAANAFVVDESRLCITFGGHRLELTHHEYHLLAFLLRSPERVFTRGQIMQAAWPDAAVVSERTIDTHIKTLRQKLKQVAPEQDPIKTHRGHGYSIVSVTTASRSASKVPS
jgi:two-component system, OmpR family, catabolic regulation response regulator CreB